jgi:hypothetical protein
MNNLARIVRSATPSTAVQFRKNAYGHQGVQTFLRDVTALANASIDGNRYIVTGVEFDAGGRRRLSGVERDDFTGKPAYQALANEHIEPPLRIRYQAVSVDGKRVGVFSIGDCQDRPYMMRVDYSETLRRGDAYARVNNAAVKLGRRQFQSLFEEKFKDSVSSNEIEIGFPGDIIHKDREFPTCDLTGLPSAIAGAKLHELIAAKNTAQAAAANTFVARLTHARLFGSDSPYEERSTEDIEAEMRQLEHRFRDQDEHFLFEQRGGTLQLIILNQGDEPIQDASLALVMPKHSALHVAPALPKQQRDNSFVERTAAEQAAYPAVALRDDSIHVTVKLGDVPAGEPVEAFESALRVCVGNELTGRRVGIQYSLFAKNLRAPAQGKLRLRC